MEIRHARENGGSAEVLDEGLLVATVWYTDPARPSALFIDTGQVSEERARELMSQLQGRWNGRFVYVAPQRAWKVASC